jgi:hypothetical protein
MADIHPVQAIWDDEIQPQMRYRMRLWALKAGGEGEPNSQTPANASPHSARVSRGRSVVRLASIFPEQRRSPQGFQAARLRRWAVPSA